MFPDALHKLVSARKSCLCVGLDTDPSLLPDCVEGDVLAFNKTIIDATAPYTVSYKFNLAFYEAQGIKGWEILAESLAHVPEGIFTIADAKRGDIGNTATRYAQAFFQQMNFDAITVAPYMGSDSILPFLDYTDKWVFLLALTSNKGAEDFQYHTADGVPLYQQVMQTTSSWDHEGNLGYVVGATRPEKLAELRTEFPKAWFLVPGVGAQGGDLDAVMQAGWGIQQEAGYRKSGILVNSSRGVIYAAKGEDFAKAAGDAAKQLQQQMATYL